LSLLGPNILLSILLSNTLSLRCSLNISDQASHPYKTTGKIIFLYILIYIMFTAKYIPLRNPSWTVNLLNVGKNVYVFKFILPILRILTLSEVHYVYRSTKANNHAL
jgi:hypothetical protein